VVVVQDAVSALFDAHVTFIAGHGEPPFYLPGP